MPGSTLSADHRGLGKHGAAGMGRNSPLTQAARLLALAMMLAGCNQPPPDEQHTWWVLGPQE